MDFEKIVIIEDDPLVRENVTNILELEGYEAYSFSNGTEGIKGIESIIPGLILCDVMLPDMDGFQIIESINKHDDLRDIPFIFLTARAEMGDLRRGMNLGADDYITKPFHIRELLEVVRLRLEKKNRKNKTSETLENNYEKKGEQKKLTLDDHVFLPSGSEVQFILIKNIECIIAGGVYSFVYTLEGKKIIVRKLLKQWENVLPEKSFIRIHKSTIINLSRISKIEKWFNNSYKLTLMTYKEPLIISRRFANKLKEELNF